MELNEFIKKTITDVRSGILDAEKSFEKGERINKSSVTKISFDVAVTVIETGAKEGGGGINVAQVLNLGGKASSATESSNASRIKFDIGIELGGEKYLIR